MSRKNKHSKEITNQFRPIVPIAELEDAGGLELNKFVSPEPTAEEIVAKAIPEGLTMLQALSLSPVHYMAARPIESHLDVVFVTNGRRFWTARATTLEPLMIPFGGNPEIDQPVWRPIVGDEKGLRIS